MMRIESVPGRMPVALVLAGVLACMQLAGAGEKAKTVEPDYTKGEQPVQPDSPWAPRV